MLNDFYFLQTIILYIMFKYKFKKKEFINIIYKIFIKFIIRPINKFIISQYKKKLN